MSNGTDQAQPPPENTATQVDFNATYQAQPLPENTATQVVSTSTDQAQPPPVNTANLVDSTGTYQVQPPPENTATQVDFNVTYQAQLPPENKATQVDSTGTDQAQPPPENTATQLDSTGTDQAQPPPENTATQMDSNATDQAQPPQENTATLVNLTGTDQTQTPPVNTPTQVDSKSRKRASPGDGSWLPPDWRTEVKVRTTGTKAGIVDKFYYEPVTGHKCRSKNEVLYYLEHGTPKQKANKKTERGDLPSEHSAIRGSSNKGQTKSYKKAKKALAKPLNFDSLNVPEKVTWIGTNGSEEAWWPSIGDYKIQESVSQDWDRAFTLVTTLDAGNKTF